jgi:nitroreductase
MKLLTTKEAIEQRRSIRKFKTDEVSDEIIYELIEAARLAPSGCNAQPWRFKIVKDKNTLELLADAAYKQNFISEAPVVIICCLDVKGYLDGTVSGVQDLEKNNIIKSRISDILIDNVENLKKSDAREIIPRITANVMIAIEHIVLRALDFGLGTCWVRLVDKEKIKKIFSWDDNIDVVALLPLGYPDENPEPRKRLKHEEILL